MIRAFEAADSKPQIVFEEIVVFDEDDYTYARKVAKPLSAICRSIFSPEIIRRRPPDNDQAAIDIEGLNTRLEMADRQSDVRSMV